MTYYYMKRFEKQVIMNAYLYECVCIDCVIINCLSKNCKFIRAKVGFS